MPKRYHLYFFLLCICSLQIACFRQAGSYSPAISYYPHLEKKGTGQIGGSVLPGPVGISMHGAYATSHRTYVQARTQVGYSFLGSSYRQLNTGVEAMYGAYKLRNGYQSFTASAGLGTGLSSLVINDISLGALQYHTGLAQIGISENAGAARVSLGLQYRATHVYGAKLFVGNIDSDPNAVKDARDVLSKPFLHTMAGHVGWSERIGKKMRLRMAYDFTFYANDDYLFDRDCLHLGLIADIGGMQKPAKLAKRPKRTRGSEKAANRRKKHLEDE